MKKIIMVMMCILLIFSFVACNPSENNNNDNNNNNNINNNNNDNDNNNNNDNDNDNDVIEDYMIEGIDYSADPIDIEYMGTGTTSLELDDHLFTTLHLNERFNINLTYSPIASIDKVNIDLLISAKALPDCGWLYSGVPAGTAAEYYFNDIIRAFPKEYVQEYAPFTFEMMSSKPINTIMHLAPDDDSKMYCFFANRYKFDTVGWTLALRYDWMKNLGIAPRGDIIEAMPDTGIYLQSEAYTIDEFTDLIYQFTYSDPDLNGENDTIGYLTCKPNITDHGYMATVMSAYGLTQYYTDDGTGWCAPSEYTPQSKLAYAKVQEWMDSGVTFKDLYNTSWSDFWGTWYAGKGGTANTKLGWLNLTSTNDNLFGIRVTVPDSELICGPGLINNDGTGGGTQAYEENEYTESAGFFYISSTVTNDEKLKRILMLFDYMCINPTGARICNSGIEGIHYTLDKDNKVVAEDQSDFEPELKVYPAYGTPGVSMLNSPANPEGKLLKHIIYQFSQEHWPPCYTSDLIAPTAFEINMDIAWYQRENRRAGAAALSTFLKSVFTNETNLDTAWDNFFTVLNEIGYEEYLTEINTHGKLKEYMDKGEIVHPIDLYPTHGE